MYVDNARVYCGESFDLAKKKLDNENSTLVLQKKLNNYNHRHSVVISSSTVASATMAWAGTYFQAVVNGVQLPSELTYHRALESALGYIESKEKDRQTKISELKDRLKHVGDSKGRLKNDLEALKCKLAVMDARESIIRSEIAEIEGAQGSKLTSNTAISDLGWTYWPIETASNSAQTICKGVKTA